MITESSDPDGRIPQSSIPASLSQAELVWLGSLFLAFEQIYVATLALSRESQRVWRLYLKNQLNKPYIRDAFVRDAINSKDYHREFWRFVRGIPCAKSELGYRNFAIHPKFFDTTPKEPIFNNIDVIYSEEFNKSHLSFWADLYKDDDVRRNMYAAPSSSEEEFFRYLISKNAFTVFKDKKPIGGFTISIEKDQIGTFGLVLHQNSRGKRLSELVLEHIELEAKRLGILTLRGDVYSDNIQCIRALEKKGFRKFIWLEKNI